MPSSDAVLARVFLFSSHTPVQPMSSLITINEAAERLGLRHKSVRRLLDAGELDGVDVGRKGAKRRTLRVHAESVDSFLTLRSTTLSSEPATAKPARRSKCRERLEYLRRLNGDTGQEAEMAR
jgi:excisionase family DNA binding protein